MTDIQTTPRQTHTQSTWAPLRIATIVLLLAVAALYTLVLAIQLPHLQEADNPAPAYGFLAIVYVLSAAVYAWRDTSRVAWVLA